MKIRQKTDTLLLCLFFVPRDASVMQLSISQNRVRARSMKKSRRRNGVPGRGSSASTEAVPGRTSPPLKQCAAFARAQGGREGFLDIAPALRKKMERVNAVRCRTA